MTLATKETPEVLIKKLFEDAKVPERAHPTDSGLDLSVYKIDRVYNVNETLITPSGEDADEWLLKPGERALVNTGNAATVGVGYEIQIRPRSGLALKNGLTVLNTPGTIDESYRGALGVIVINLSNTAQKISKGMKIAQMVVCPVTLSPVVIVTDLDETVRGAGGFGHTGV